MNSASNNQGPDSEPDANENIVLEMSDELKQLVLSWVTRLDLVPVSGDAAVNMMVAVLEAGIESIVRVCEGISGGTAS